MYVYVNSVKTPTSDGHSCFMLLSLEGTVYVLRHHRDIHRRPQNRLWDHDEREKRVQCDSTRLSAASWWFVFRPTYTPP